MKNIDNYNEEIFEKIKHVDEYGNEYWYARELQKVLDYNEYRFFLTVINKSIATCLRNKRPISDHFVHVHDMVDIGSNAKRKINNYKLSRYACYLIALNCDPRKEVISLAKDYFIVQTRKQELLEEELEGLSEDERRLRVRKQVKDGNYGLNRTAINAGVRNLGEFHNAGYKGLYNGETANDIAKRKNLQYNQDILDFMGSEELAANLFRITQTEGRLNREKVDNEYKANDIHYEIGKEVRDSIKRMKGNMPETLPTPKVSSKKIKEGEKNASKSDENK